MWFDIVKDVQSYGDLLTIIEEVEKLLEGAYADIEDAAVDVSKDTGMPLEAARRLVRGIQKDTLELIESKLEDYKRELPSQMGDIVGE